ncbi:transferase [Syncephalis fuscata]|nr:transferase [Syncephalis fuscata]
MTIQSKEHGIEEPICQFRPPEGLELKSAYVTPLDMIMPMTYNRHIYFYRNPDPTTEFMPTEQLAAGLEKALTYYPVLYAGITTLPDLQRVFEPTGAPIPLYEQQVDYGFEKFEPHWRHKDIPTKLDVLSVRADIANAPMLAARITRLRNNEGVVVTIAVHHVVADGFGVEIFMETWTACVRGEEPSPLPCHERSLISPTGPPSEEHPEYYWVKPEYASFEYAFTPSEAAANAAGETPPPPMKTAIFRVSAEHLAQLKREALLMPAPDADLEDVSDVAWISSGDALTALIWQAITRAGHTSGQLQSSFHIAANSRARFEPPLPYNYFGNASFRINPVAMTEKLKQMPLGYLARLIRKRNNEMDGNRLQSAVNWLAALPEHQRLRSPIQVMFGIDFALANLAFPQMYDVNFGYGRPVRRRLPYDNWNGGAVIFSLPPSTADGPAGQEGVEFYLGMLAENFNQLLADEEFIRFAEYIG